MADDTVSLVLRRLEDLRADKSGVDADYRDVRNYVRPKMLTSGSGQQTSAVRDYAIAYDGTAPRALTDLAAALHAFLTSPTDRWFDLGVAGLVDADLEADSLLWLEAVADIMYTEYSRDESGFNMALHEAYLDLGSFGTDVIYQEYSKSRSHLIFTTENLTGAYIGEGENGQVNTIFLERFMRASQIKERWPNSPVHALLNSMKPSENLKVVHAVLPRLQRNTIKMNNLNMPFGSVWVLVDKKALIHESGFMTFPYHVSRWIKQAGEVYGRSPAMECMPDIRLLNKMDKTVIKAAEKAADPPLVVTDDGFMLPIKTAPGSLIFKEAGTEAPLLLESRGNFPVTFEIMQQKIQHIKDTFHADWIRLEKQNVEMTAYEVADRREEKLRLLGPMLSRQQGEKLGPLLRRSFGLLKQHGRIPPAPRQLQNQRLSVIYVSPAARAQTGVKAMSMNRYIQELVPVAQFRPEVLDAINTDGWAQLLAEYRGVPRRAINTAEQIRQIRAIRAKQEQAAQLVQAAEPVSKAVKNISDASASGGLAQVFGQ